jgi:hypothetical protein
MAGSTHAAPLWRSILLAVLLWVYVEAKPAISMDYCASFNTASMPASEFPALLTAQPQPIPLLTTE